MSRLVEIFHDWARDLSPTSIPLMLEQMCDRLDTRSAEVAIGFSYFIERIAPVSCLPSMTHYEVSLAGRVNCGAIETQLAVAVPVTALCPCSKAISDYGAHNQRGLVRIEVHEHSESCCPITIEDLVAVAESSGSAPVYPLVKRSDERHLTMQAYDHPVFVEDMVREVAQRLMADQRVAGFAVAAQTEESIHDHAAFAAMEWSRPVATGAALPRTP